MGPDDINNEMIKFGGRRLVDALCMPQRACAEGYSSR